MKTTLTIFILSCSLLAKAQTGTIDNQVDAKIDKKIGIFNDSLQQFYQRDHSSISAGNIFLDSLIVPINASAVFQLILLEANTGNMEIGTARKWVTVSNTKGVYFILANDDDKVFKAQSSLAKSGWTILQNGTGVPIVYGIGLTGTNIKFRTWKLIYPL